MATITTTTDVVLLAIDAVDFHECFADCPQLVAEFIVRMKGRNVDLRSALNHYETRTLFTPFVKEQHGIENLKFYDEIENFRSSFNSMSEDEVERAAQSIVQRYLTQGATDAINVSHEIYQRTQDIVLNRKYGADMFAQPQNEILKLMEQDVFARFKKSEEFNSLLSKIRFYDELDSQLLA